MTKAKNDYVLTGRPKKRLFIGMLSLTAVLMAVILYAIWYIGVPGLRAIQPMLPWLIGAVFTFLVAGAFFSIFNMVLAVAHLPYLPFLQRQTYELINLLFPLAVRLGLDLSALSRRSSTASSIPQLAQRSGSSSRTRR